MRKRSAYRPKCAPGAIPVVFSLSQKMKTDLQLTPMGILEGFKEGTGTEVGGHTLAAAVNVAAVLARSQPEEVQCVAARGLDAIRGVFLRASEAGRWGCSGDEYRAIGEALALCADMQDVVTRRDVAAAIRTTLKEAGR